MNIVVLLEKEQYYRGGVEPGDPVTVGEGCPSCHAEILEFACPSADWEDEGEAVCDLCGEPVGRVIVVRTLTGQAPPPTAAWRRSGA